MNQEPKREPRCNGVIRKCHEGKGCLEGGMILRGRAQDEVSKPEWNFSITENVLYLVSAM